MQDEQVKTIVDSNGNVFKENKKDKLKEILKNNVWNILGVGLPAVISFLGLFNWIISKNFSVSCANFYGVDRKYFSGTALFEDKFIFFVCALILFLYPFIFSYINKKMNSKLYVVLTFLLTIMILFIQNIMYTVNLLDIITWDWLKSIIDNYVMIAIYLVSDILIAYFVIIRNFFVKKKKYNMFENTILVISIIIYVLNVAIGIEIRLDYDISDKKSYEVIEQNRAIISNYDGKYVVMDCKIQDNEIILKKGTYSIEEMTGVTITYREYDKVICK